MDHAAGWDEYVPRKKRKGAKNKPVEPDTVPVRLDEAEDRRLDWLQLGENTEEVFFRQSTLSTWKARLTPLIPFPKLIFMTRILDSLKAAEEKSKVMDKKEGEAGLGLSDVPASVAKAQENPLFAVKFPDVLFCLG